MNIPYFLQISALVLISALSLAAMSFVFEFHYMWFLNPVRGWVLRGGLAAGGITLIALWVFFPHYWAVALVGILVFVFPVFVPGIAVSLSLRLLITMTVAIMLLIGATAFRRYLFPQ